MRSIRLLLAGLVVLGLPASYAFSAGPPAEAKSGLSPLRLIPAEADFAIEVHNPRQAVDAVVRLDFLKEIQVFSIVREQLGSTQARRGRQLLAYFEKQMGAKWPEILDKVAGGGLAAASKIGANNAPALLVVQGKDKKAVEKFVAVALQLVEDELDRSESKEKIHKKEYHGIATAQIGKQFFMARAGRALLFSNNETALKRGLDLHLGRARKNLAGVAGIEDARRLLPKDPLVNLWLNMKPVRKSPQAKALYQSPRDDTNLTVLFGSALDVFGRTPFMAAAIAEQKDGFRLTIRVPRGREGMGNDRLLHVPAEGEAGSRPLLEPKSVLYSQSFYLDLAALWNEREKLMPKKVADAFMKFNKTSGRFLAGAKVGTLLSQTGPYHRIVVVNQPEVPYKKKPKQTIPAFAFITELREPAKFGKSMNTILRAAGFLTSFQVKLKLTEETHQGVKIVGYRFPENAEFKADVEDIRFGFSPCFAQVGKQFVWCSTVELCRELVELLQAEEKGGARGDRATSRIRLYAEGGADFLAASTEDLIAQTILDQAVEPQEARVQVKALVALVRKLGGVRLESTYLDKEFRYELTLKTRK
jgi:hypothetical protein